MTPYISPPISHRIPTMQPAKSAKLATSSAAC
jgi:hypothetical protein